MEKIHVPPHYHGLALDEFLGLRFPRVAKGRIRRWIREGRISVDGETQTQPKPVQAEEWIQLELPDRLPQEAAAQPVAIPVLHEDEEVLCVNKPAGIAVEPERWKKERGSLVESLLSGMEDRSGPLLPYRPRAVHRLDKDTSGVLILAKTLESERNLRVQFENRRVKKHYLALVEGEVPGEGGEVNLPIAPDPRKPGRMMVHREGGKAAHSLYRVVERFREFTWLEVIPLTGRTHQIRVHLRSRGFPLLVDPLYGRRGQFFLSSIKPFYHLKKGSQEKPLLSRLSLHASRLQFSGIAGNEISVEAPLPKDLEITVGKLRKFRSWK